MSPALLLLTRIHTAISLVAILAGFVAIAQMIGGQTLGTWNLVFFWTTFLTSVTGFFFPFKGLKPAHIFGVITIAVMIPMYMGFYQHGLAGSWRKVYVIGAVFVQYLNFFVLIVQSFQKIPALNVYAPTQKEKPFAIAQGLALILFITLGLLAY